VLGGAFAPRTAHSGSAGGGIIEIVPVRLDCLVCELIKRELAIKALPGPISGWPDDRQSILGDFDGGVVSLAAVGVCRFPLFSFDNRTIRIITLGAVGKII
jgi:hypothetical protein